jgi:class 3 adenylate cyclase
MKKKKREKALLLPRKIDIAFDYQNALVAYDPANKFYRATFDFNFEKEIYDFVESFVNLVFSDEKQKEFGALPSDTSMTTFYFRVMSDFNNINWQLFSNWYYAYKPRLQQKFKEIVINTIVQEKNLKIPELEFLCWLSSVSLVSVVFEDYFHSHFEQLSIMKETVMGLLGNIFEIMFMEIYEDREIDRLRAEKTGEDKKKILPLINRYTIIYNDIADLSHVEKMLTTRDERIIADRQVLTGLLHALGETVSQSRRIGKQSSIRQAAADIAMIKMILADRHDRMIFSSMIKKDKELKERMTLDFAKENVRRRIYEIISETGSGALLNVIKHQETFEEIFYEGKTRKYVCSALKEIGSRKAKDLIRYIDDGVDRIRRSRNSIIVTLTGKEFDEILWKMLGNFSLHFRAVNDFHEVRQKYGKKSVYSEEMLGIKIMRQSMLKHTASSNNNGDGIECVSVPDEEKTRIENHFEEANLFYFRRDGAVYPGERANVRGKKFFMFADLRNSTETTMKLTKDTAAFLTPYLNTVYRVSKENGGTEIYFAGDGYAAHFSRVTDCLRSAYIIHREFSTLRKDAEIKIAEKEKYFYRELFRLKIIDQNWKILKLPDACPSYAEEINEAIVELGKPDNAGAEAVVRRLAEEYSMPRVEIGIGITEGELFFAVIGEESIRFNIVLSPSLTQAARLSGSNGEVKAYLEKLYGIKNIPRKVFVNQKKLFNQGVVITRDVYEALKHEVVTGMLEQDKLKLSYDIEYYFDAQLDRHVCLSKLDQGVSLKGIEQDVDVLEVFTQTTQVDAYANNWLNENKQGAKR